MFRKLPPPTKFTITDKYKLLLGAIAARARRHVSAAMMRTINRVCGAIIAAFGCYALAAGAFALA